MSSVKNGDSIPSHKKPGDATKDDGYEEKKVAESGTREIAKEENKAVKKSSTIPEPKDVKVKTNLPLPDKPSSVDNSVSNNTAAATTSSASTATTTSRISQDKMVINTVKSSETTTKKIDTSGPPAQVTNRSDAKHVKKELLATRSEATTPAASAPKSSQQQPHSKAHTQIQQQQQQYRYSVPSRQNQEEAVSKMVQNIFKLLETRGPLTMAQLEYNLPILIMGSSPSTPITPQTMNATTSKSNPVALRDSTIGDSNKDTGSVTRKQSSDTKASRKRFSLCEEKLIPGNAVPDIVELLVTLGLIQQQTDGAISSASTSSQDHEARQPRFAVHFGKPKQFLVTPTNILSEIAKAQTEIQLSRQRQESLKEALSVADHEAAEKVKHIVLQHPQVVDDPVYVTALRNLQVDGMLMAGTSGTTSAGNSNASTSSTIKGGVGKSKAGVGGSGKKLGGGKRRPSGSAQAKRKRQKPKKDANMHNGDVGNSLGRRAVAASDSSKQMIRDPTATERSELPRSISTPNQPKSMQSGGAVTPSGTNQLLAK